MGTMLVTRNLRIYGAKAFLKERTVQINLENSLNNSKWGEGFFKSSFPFDIVPLFIEELLENLLLLLFIPSFSLCFDNPEGSFLFFYSAC